MDRELLQDSDGVNESLWDGQGVEIEAEQVFDARVCGDPWGPESPGLGDLGSRVPGLGDPRFRVPGNGVPINSRPTVPGRLNFGGAIGGEIGGVG